MVVHFQKNGEMWEAVYSVEPRWDRPGQVCLRKAYERKCECIESKREY